MAEVELLRIVFGAGMALAAGWDAGTGRIPNFLTVPVAAAGLVAAWFAGGWPAMGQAVLGMLLPLFALLPVVSAGWLGAGDAKLLASAGAWVGPVGVLGVWVLGSLIGGVVAVGHATVWAYRERWGVPILAGPQVFMRHVRERLAGRRIAYGPALALAAVIWMFWGDWILAG